MSFLAVGNIRGDFVPEAASHSDSHTVVSQQTGEVQLKKSVDRALDLEDGRQIFTLQVQNFSESLAIQPFTVIDVLSYNGDQTDESGINRTPGSEYSGANTLSGAPTAFELDGETTAPGTFFYTTVEAANVPQHASDDTDPSIWSTTFTAQATAFKFVADNPLATVGSGSAAALKIIVETEQVGNVAGDLYANRFSAFSESLINAGRLQLLASNQVSVRVLGFSVGDLIWFDADRDGTFTQDVDTPVPEGVHVEVYDEDDVKMGEVETDANGRWVLNDIPRGRYYAVIPASEFETGGLLEGAFAAPGAETDPNTDLNEDVDHHTVATADGGVRTSNLLSLDAEVDAEPISGLEPVGENVGGVRVAPLTGDDFTNLTLDMALVGPAEFTLAKVIDGDGSDFATGPFIVEVTCLIGGEAVPGYPQEVSFAAAGDRILTAPDGASCSASETQTGSATSVAVNPASAVTVSSDPDIDDSITVTNTFDLGALSIRKEVAGAGAEFSGSTFEFSVTCSFSGVEAAFVDQVRLEVDGAGSYTSDAVEGIPVGAICVIVETENGGADATPAAVNLVIDGDDTTTQTAGFLNEFSAANVWLSKALDGAAANDSFVEAMSFRTQLTCQIDREGTRVELYSGLIDLQPNTPVVASVVAAGEDGVKEALLLPLGARCFAEELVMQGAAASAVDAATFESGAAVTASAGGMTGQLSITVTNTFETEQVVVSTTGSGSSSFETVCTYPLENDEGTSAVDYPLAPEDATFVLREGETKRITVLAGVTCRTSQTGSFNDGSFLGITGGTSSAWLVAGGISLLGAGAVLWLVTRRRILSGWMGVRTRTKGLNKT
ncbi:DUF5979 domain-containing protein [Microbacterium sp. NPDC076768]|uniref:DUF5979 domain-containing protein n=1 Tax=Microbacterium sp. NPDC076768 TaxID=3154858 RepID=UPI00343C0DED